MIAGPLRRRSRSRAPGPHRQRGVAMMVAILLVAFGTILAASIAFEAAMAARRSTSTLAVDQSLLVAQAAEALAAYVLREDFKAGKERDHPAESWGQPLGPVEVVPGVTLEAYLEDATGRFNLNSLIDAQNQVDPVALEKLQNLMQQVQVEPKWASMIADWIDADTVPLPEGAEDSAYSAQDPPYRPPNTVITSPSELLAMPGFGRERYLRLLPYVTALPRDATINICSAGGVLLDALVDASYSNFGPDPEALAKARESDCFPDDSAYAQSFGGQGSQEWQQVESRIGMKSSYFRLTSIVTIGSAEFALYSLLERDPNSQVHVVMRSFTPD